jgi:hypothetical protein
MMILLETNNTKQREIVVMSNHTELKEFWGQTNRLYKEFKQYYTKDGAELQNFRESFYQPLLTWIKDNFEYAGAFKVEGMCPDRIWVTLQLEGHDLEVTVDERTIIMDGLQLPFAVYNCVCCSRNYYTNYNVSWFVYDKTLVCGAHIEDFGIELGGFVVEPVCIRMELEEK